MSNVNLDLVKFLITNKKYDTITEYAKIEYPEEKGLIVSEYAGTGVRLFKDTKNRTRVLCPKNMTYVEEGYLSEAIARGTIFDDAENVSNNAEYIEANSIPRNAMINSGKDLPKQLKPMIAIVIGKMDNNGSFDVSDADRTNGCNFVRDVVYCKSKNNDVCDVVNNYIENTDNDNMGIEMGKSVIDLSKEIDDINDTKQEEVLSDDDYEEIDPDKKEDNDDEEEYDYEDDGSNDTDEEETEETDDSENDDNEEDGDSEDNDEKEDDDEKDNEDESDDENEDDEDVDTDDIEEDDEDEVTTEASVIESREALQSSISAFIDDLEEVVRLNNKHQWTTNAFVHKYRTTAGMAVSGIGLGTTGSTREHTNLKEVYRWTKKAINGRIGKFTSQQIKTLQRLNEYTKELWKCVKLFWINPINDIHRTNIFVDNKTQKQTKIFADIAQKILAMKDSLEFINDKNFTNDNSDKVVNECGDTNVSSKRYPSRFDTYEECGDESVEECGDTDTVEECGDKEDVEECGDMNGCGDNGPGYTADNKPLSGYVNEEESSYTNPALSPYPVYTPQSISVGNTGVLASDDPSLKPTTEGFLSRKPKKLKPIPRDTVAYITTEMHAIRDSNDQAMLSGYTCSKIELVDFYITALDTQDPRYIVPHTRQYLEQMSKDLDSLLTQILNIRPVNRNDRVWRVNVNYPEGWRG